VAVVTGASRGIGAAIAERFASEGAMVVVTARTIDPQGSRLPGTIHETVERIRGNGGVALALAADLSHVEQRATLVDGVLERWGAVDILVNNAAVSFFQPVSEFSAKRLQLMFDVQVAAPLHLSQMVLPGMVDRGEGWILNVSSRAALHPRVPPDPKRVGATVYGMCKAAVERFSTGLASETYDHNIAVNALSPNLVVPTPGTLFHQLVRPDDPDQVVEWPAVMAEAALALCSVAPQTRTGLIAYSQDLLDELGIVVAGGDGEVEP
jgi:citronellol/citronellal dehydrogenase